MARVARTALAVSALAASAVGHVATAGAATTGGGSDVPAATTRIPKCVVLLGQPGQKRSTTIGNRRDGGTVCMTVGAKLLVWLVAPAVPGATWRQVEVSKAGVLLATASPVHVPAGVTAAAFRAVRAGSVKLTSQRPACAPANGGSASCGAVLGWGVTVMVLAPPKAFPQPQ
jgi:hypothetical protein